MEILELNNIILENQILVYTILIVLGLFVFILILKLVFKSKVLVATRIEDGLLLSIEVPRFNDKGALAAEQMFASLHGLFKYTPGIQEHISFEITSSSKGIKFFVFVPAYFHKFVEGQIYAQYPSAEIRVIEDYSEEDVSNYKYAGAEVVVNREYFFPIKTFRDFEVDPLAAITGAFEKLEDENGKLWFQMMVRPVPDDWQEEGHAYVTAVREGKETRSGFSVFAGSFINEFTYIFTGFLSYLISPSRELGVAESGGSSSGPQNRPRLSAGQEIALKAIENKLTKLGFETSVRIMSFAEGEEQAQKQLASAIASLKQFSTANLNSFERSSTVGYDEKFLKKYRQRYFPEDKDDYFLLNIEELASVFHLPSESVETPNIAWVNAKKGEPPLNLPLEDCAYIGKTIFRDEEILFGIKPEDRRKHMYIIGKTGVGKSTLIKNMAISDMIAGAGIAVLDPHGDLIEDLLAYVPEERKDDVVIFDPSDSNYPVSLNMLELFDESQKDLYASGLLDVFKKYFGFSWGPRLEYILRNCILTLLEIPNSTLLGITRLLVDEDYEDYIVSQVQDPVVKAFWKGEFANIRKNNRLFTEAIQPIQNKVGQFLSAATIRNIVGQARSSVKIDEVINSGKIFFVNLSKGKIGADNSSLLGAMIISRLQFAAMARVKIPEEERRDFYVYADEFQSFATESFSGVLSEARKYRLSLILAHQYIDQLPEEVREAVFGNIGTLISFTVGSKDARFLESEFAPVFEQNDLVNLQMHHIYLKMMIDGMNSQPFSAKTLPPTADKTNIKDEIVALSREKHSSDLSLVENRIKKWTATKFKRNMQILIKRKPSEETVEPERETSESSPSEENSKVEALSENKVNNQGEEPQPISQTPDIQDIYKNNPNPFNKE